VTLQARRIGIPNRAGLAVAALVILLFGTALIIAHVNAPSEPAANMLSTNPTSFDLPRLDGAGDVHIGDYKGRPAVVTFFASWCTACQSELPGFDAVSRTLVGRVTFVGIDSMETGNGLAMARQLGIAWWPLARDIHGLEASGLHDALGGIGMPITAFYSADGAVVAVVPGALTEPELDARLRAYFGTMTAPVPTSSGGTPAPAS